MSPYTTTTFFLNVNREQTVVQGLLVYAMSLHIVSWNVNGFHASGTHGPRKLIETEALAGADWTFGHASTSGA